MYKKNASRLNLGITAAELNTLIKKKKITEIESITDICLTKLFSYLGLYTTLCHNIIKIVGHLPVYTKHKAQYAIV